MAVLLFSGWLAAAAALSPQRGGAAVRIVSPEDGSYVSGATLIRAAVQPPGAPVMHVAFFADGKLVCQVQRQPFECHWDAGPGVTAHSLRVVATLATGERLVRNATTKGVAFAETVDVAAVQLSVAVLDGHRFVKGLKREDFRVWEDGEPQALSSFAAEDIPLELIAAIDISSSMRDAIPHVRAAVKQFLTALRPADQVTLVGFNQSLYTVARPSVDLATRLAAVDRLAAWGTTSLYDVIVQSLDLLGNQQGRRALVVFTDGEDQGSVSTLDIAEQRAQASDATLYLVGQGRGTELLGLKHILERLARTSGGRAFTTDKPEKLKEAFAEIVQELSSQYLLSYTPSHDIRDGKWHKLKVEVRGYDVRTRDGYRYNTPGK